MTEIFIAFGAGLISFLSPCVLPLIPGYISYISGSTLENLLKSKNVNLLPIILFTLGFSVVFIIFGASATFLGKILLNYKKVIIPEINRGQLRYLIRAEYLIDAIGLNEIKGKPIGASTIMNKCKEIIDG